MKKLVFSFFLILYTYLTYSQCVSWQNGISTNTTINQASDYLCNHFVIDPSQNANDVYNNPIKKKELAVLLYRTLFTNGTAQSDYYPVPFIDVDLSLLNQEEYDACKAMHYLDFSDGISPFSRDYFFTNEALSFSKKGDVLRAIMEAWNIAPNNTGYNSNANYSSSFYSDVLVNDPNYGWIQTAYQYGLTNNLPLSTCQSTCLNTSTPFTLAQVYVMFYRLWQIQSPPVVLYSHFFVPNNFSIKNISNKGDIERAVFSNYEDPSFAISGGGFSLTFAHSYHSDLTELPYINDDYFYNNKEVYTQSLFPLGIGWSHSLNIHIKSIKNYVGGTFNEERLMVVWPEGNSDVFNRINNAYETPGIKDVLDVLSTTAQGYANRIKIYKRNGSNYYFTLEPQLGIHHIDSIVDRNGNKLVFTYQAGYPMNGYTPLRLRTVSGNTSNRYLTLNYQASSNYIYSVTDPINRVIYFSVDPSTHQLNSFTDAKGQTTSYNYDQGVYKHLLVSIQRPKGNTITNTYQQRKLNSTQANAYAVNVSFNANYLQGSTTSSSQVSVTQNGSTHTTTYQHNDRGNPTQITSTTQNTTILYDALNPDLPQQVTDNLTGVYKQFTYDFFGNPTYSSTNTSSNSIGTSTTYTNYDLVQSITDANGNVTNYNYDGQGNLLSEIKPGNIATTYVVNTQGNVTQKTDPIGVVTNYGYNSYGNLQTISIQGASVSASATYDGASRVTSITDPSGILSSYLYDNNDNVTDENYDPSGLNYNTHYSYDANDNLTQTRDPKQQTTNLTYDFNTDDLVAETYGAYSKYWTYNTDGTLASHTTKNNHIFNYLYFPSGDPRAGLVRTDGYADYEYNTTTKQLQSITRSGTSNQLSYAYDDFGRTIGVTYNDLPNNTVSYEYDNNGNVTTLTYPFNGLWKIHYSWDNNNRLTYVYDWNNIALAHYVYRPNGQIADEYYANGTSTHYHYDAIGRVDSIYTHDSNGKLICYSAATSNNAGHHTREGIFTDTSNTTDYTLQAPTYFNYDNMNRLQNTSAGAYTYDGNGNILNDVTTGATYGWDIKDNMLSYTKGGYTKFCEYDPLENRRKYDTTRFALDILGKGNVLVETDLSGTPKALYVHGLGLICRIDLQQNQSKAFYHYDFRGSTIAVTNDTQHVIAHYTYDAFGAILSEKQPTFKNWFTYVGKYGVMQDEQDRYYMRARHYIPSIGRFIGEDPVWSTNLFPYADNNPISHIDPDGEFLETALDVISFGYDAYQFYKEPTIGNFINVAWSAASILVPGVPGSYAKKGLKFVSKISETKSFSKIGKFFTESKYVVYHGIDGANNVRYVGITKRSPIERFLEHKRSGKEFLNFDVIEGATNLSRKEARILEQKLINQYGLGKNGGFLLNRINSIAKKKWYRFGIH